MLKPRRTQQRKRPTDVAPAPATAAPAAPTPPPPQPQPAEEVAARANAILAYAAEKLRQRSPEASTLFAAIAQDHDVREAWLGLATARHLQSHAAMAGEALARALSRHAVTAVPPTADAIVQSLHAPGWCALDGAGILTVGVMADRRGAARPTATLDGKPLRLVARSDGRRLTARLPGGWQTAREIRVTVGDEAMIGSPIQVSGIARTEGFVDSIDGDLHGWAWCPNDPDRNPTLSILPVGGGPGTTVVADDVNIRIVSRTPLARPRGFRVPAERLRMFDGPVRVLGPDGRNLTGSPLYPAAERHSAEAAARMVAQLFPASGKRRVSALGLSIPSVPAHVIGGPVRTGRKRRPVDVVVPVYGGLEMTLRCIDSVLADLPRWARIVVVDDASPDPRIRQELGQLAAKKRIILLPQPVNRGFPSTANVGMRHDAERDVVLLNSDTLVPPGWLERLRDAAYSAPDIGSVTPVSNDATILSYPSVEHGNAIPDLAETQRLDSLARQANDGRLIDIPTAVGFCTYIKRDCLEETGLLREDVFAQGYGEENDFCVRARHLGWRHVAAPGLFVAHVGGQSFGATKHYLIERNLRKLNQLHPGYDILVHDFLRADPMAEPRRRMDLERWKTYRTRARSVLLIVHGRGGGVQRHVGERAAALRAEGLRPIVLWPVASRDGTGRDCVLGNGPEGGTPNLRFAIPDELDLLARTLKGDRPIRAEVHHLIGHDHRLMDLFRKLGIPYSLTVHDYSWFCPRINLVGGNRRYCGEPDIADCESCVAQAGTTNDEDTPVRALLERSTVELANAAQVIVPSEDVASRIRRHFPMVRPTIIDWEDDSVLPPIAPAPLSPDGVYRVCVVGAIGIEKGFDVLLACARDVVERNLNLRFHIVGHTCDDARLLEAGAVSMTGRYNEAEVISLIHRQGTQLAWLPSLWPETWCYTLTQAWQAGLRVAAFDIGTPAQRIRQTGRGWLFPLGITPRALNDRLRALAANQAKLAETGVADASAAA